MEHNRKDLDEMYSSDDEGEYIPESGVQNFSVQVSVGCFNIPGT